MSVNKMPLVAEELTTEWLQVIMTPHLHGAELKDFDAEIIGVGEGFMGQLARVNLHYIEDNDSYKKVEGSGGDPDTYFREHSYHTDRIPDGLTAPENANVMAEEVSGKLIGQKIKRKKPNPDFNESLEYVGREERDEWQVVGLLGQIPIIKGQPTGSSWVKMKDVSNTVEMYFVK